MSERKTEAAEGCVPLSPDERALQQILDTPSPAGFPNLCGAPRDLLQRLLSEVARLRTAQGETQTWETHESYIAYLKARAAAGLPAYVSQAFLRAMNATTRELSEVDEVLGVSDDLTDEEAQQFRLSKIQRAEAAERSLAETQQQLRIVELNLNSTLKMQDDLRAQLTAKDAQIARLREKLTEICTRIEAKFSDDTETFRELSAHRKRVLDSVYAIAEAALAEAAPEEK